MYSKIILVFCLLVITFAVFRYKKYYHPLIPFNSLWMIIFVLESFHLYGLCECRTSTYGLFLLGIVAFSVGFIVKEKSFQNKRVLVKWGERALNDENDMNYTPNYVIIYILGIICVLYYLTTAFDSLRMLINGCSFAEIRSAVQKSDALVDASIWKRIINAIRILIIVPFSAVIQVVGCVNFWVGKRDRKLIVLALVLAFLSSISEGGRMSIATVLIYLLVGFFVSGRQIKLQADEKRKRRRRIIASVTLIGSTLAYITVSRAGQSIVRFIYLYFSMQPYMFQVWSDRAVAQNIMGYGEASLNGFFFAVLYIIKNVFGTGFPSHWEKVYALIRSTDSTWIAITNSSIKANAYVSSFWFLYLDGRAFGIGLGMFLYGFMISTAYSGATQRTNPRTVAIYCFLFQGLMFTFIRFPFSNIYYAISYIMLLTIAFKKTKRKLE